MYNNDNYYYQNSSNENVQQEPTSTNDNAATSYNPSYNYYDNQQYAAYNSQFYNSSYPYSTYYQSSFNNYQYQYNFNQAAAPAPSEKLAEHTPAYPAYTYNPQVNLNANKPSTPLPSVAYEQQTTQSEQTPEKPVMNDSGVELISPQIVNSSYTNTSAVQESNKPGQPEQLQYPAFHQFNASAHVDAQKEEVQPLADVSNENNQQNDVSIEDEDEEDEELEDAKENKKAKSKKPTSSADSSLQDNPSKPPKPYLEIIADAILSSKVRMMQLHEIYYFMEAKYEYFAKNVNKSWRNSVRHNLSLNECFVKAGRGYNGKGNYWKIHHLCEKEFIRGNFRRKSFKQAIRAGSSSSSNSSHASNNNAGNNFTYSLPIDYNNFRSLLPPPPLPQQFLNKTSTFQYPISAYQQQQPALAYPGSAKLNEASAQSSFNPYRV